MDAFWTIGVTVALLLNVLTILATLGLARELAGLLARAGPEHAKPSTMGPEIGEAVGPISVLSSSGEDAVIGGGGQQRKSLLLFVSPTCPVCESMMIPILTFARSYAKQIATFVVSRSEADSMDSKWRSVLGHSAAYWVSPEVHQQFQISGTPYAILLTNENILESKGIVNSLEQLESLISVEGIALGRHETGWHDGSMDLNLVGDAESLTSGQT